MPNHMRTRLGLAVIATVAISGWMAITAQGQSSSSAPVIRPPFAEAALAHATTNGEALLAKARWRAAIKNSSTILTVVGQTLLCEGTEGGNRKATALDLRTGRPRWESAAIDFSGGARGRSLAPADADIEVVQGSIGQITLLRLEADTGTPSTLWQTRFGEAANQGISPYATFADQRVIAGGGYTFAWRGGNGPRIRQVVPLSIRSFDRQTGKEQWATPVDGGAISTSRPILTAGKVYVMVDQSKEGTTAAERQPRSFLLALNGADGKVLWSTLTVNARQFTPAVREQLVITATEKGTVTAYDAQTGKEKWHSEISAVCDASKSTVASVEVVESQIWIDSTWALVPAVATPGATTNRSGTAGTEQIVGAFALFDLQTGRQTAYFGGISRKVSRPSTTPLEVLGIRMDTLFVKVGNGACLGINQKTLRPECYLPCAAAVSSDGVLYINTRSSPNAASSMGGYLQAVSLDAWDGVRAAAAK